MLTELSKEIHENNVKKGFYDEPKSNGEIIALIHSEVSEALESDRKGRFAKLRGDEFENLSSEDIFKGKFEALVKDSFEDELADAIIRLLDLAGFRGIDIGKHVELKLEYNKLRPYKHGKRY